MNWTESGFAIGKTDSCKAPLTLHVYASGDIEGKTTCSTALYGDIDMVFTGTIVGKTDIDGTIDFAHGGFSWSDVWDGEIKEPKTLDGAFKGGFGKGSLTYSYDGYFSLSPS